MPGVALGIALILGIDHFMLDAHAWTHFVGNGTAKIVVSVWESELGRAKMKEALGAGIPLGSTQATISVGHWQQTTYKAKRNKNDQAQRLQNQPERGYYHPIGWLDRHSTSRQLFRHLLFLAIALPIQASLRQYCLMRMIIFPPIPERSGRKIWGLITALR